MKNLYLFLVLIGLLTFVYMTQEKKSIDQKEQADFVSRLVIKEEYGRLKEIQTPYNHLVRKDDKIVYFHNHFRVNELRINEFLKRISNIRAKKSVDPEKLKDRKAFFPKEFPQITFRMEKMNIVFKLGKQLDYSQDFYVEIIKDGKSEVVIAHDTSPYEGVVYNQQESHRSDHKYKRVKALFYLPVNFFMDLRIFENAASINELKFTNIRNKSFKVNFKNYSTDPAPLAGIRVSKELIDYFKVKFRKFEAESYIPSYDPTKLGRKVGEIFAGKRSVSIHESYAKDNRYYIKSKVVDGLFKIKSGEQRIFLFNVQTLWDLKPFEDVKGDISVKFDSGEKLMLGSHEFGLKANHTLQLLETSAKYILDDVEDSHYKYPKLHIGFNGRDIEFHFTDREIILVDRRLKISYHYERLDKDYISIDPDDYRKE